MHVSMNLWASHFKRKIFVEEFYYCYCEVEFTIQLFVVIVSISRLLGFLGPYVCFEKCLSLRTIVSWCSDFTLYLHVAEGTREHSGIFFY